MIGHTVHDHRSGQEAKLMLFGGKLAHLKGLHTAAGVWQDNCVRITLSS